MPREIVERINAEIARALAVPEVKERLVSTGFEPGGISADRFSAMVAADPVKMGKIVKGAGIQAN